MNFKTTSEFAKEFKQYAKKYRSLVRDLQKFKILIGSSSQLDAVQFFQGKQATRLQRSATFEVVKARLDCADLGSKQLLRVIYIRSADSVLFVELYAKNQQVREDTQRIQRYLPR